MVGDVNRKFDRLGLGIRARIRHEKCRKLAVDLKANFEDWI